MARKRANGEGTIFPRIVKRKDRNGNIVEHEYWIAELTIGFDENKKRIKKTISGKSQKEVAAKKKELLAKQLNGELVMPSDALFKSWLHTYLHKYKKLSVQNTTFDKYETLSRVHIYDSSIGKKQIQKLTTKDIQTLIAEKAEKYASSTVKELHSIIRMALEQAVDEGLIPKNVANKTSLPRIEAKAVEPLTDEEITNLFYTLKNWNTKELAKKHKRPYFPEQPQEHWLSPAILLELGSGLRRGELLALQWKNVDFINNTITIIQSYVKTKAGNQMKNPKTKSSIRNISIPSSIMDKLKVHQQKNHSPEYVFTQRNDNTKPICPRHFSRTFKTICEKTGLKTTRFHDMRHSFASQQLALNTHIKVVQAQLGHTDIKTTLNRYSHLTQGIQEEASIKLNEKLKHII